MPAMGKLVSDNTLVNILLSEDPRIEFGKPGSVVCPACGDVMFVIDGEHRQSHFRHKSGECNDPYPHDEAHESAEHFQAKALLFYRLTKLYPANQGYSVELEVGLPEAGRRADILVRHNGGWSIAYEIQLSNISIQAFDERTNAYRNSGIDVHWLLGGKAATPSNIDWSRHATGRVLLVDFKDEIVNGSFEEVETASGFAEGAGMANAKYN